MKKFTQAEMEALLLATQMVLDDYAEDESEGNLSTGAKKMLAAIKRAEIKIYIEMETQKERLKK